MSMVSYVTALLRVEVQWELEFAYARGRLLVFGIREVSTPVGLPWCNPFIFVERVYLWNVLFCGTHYSCFYWNAFCVERLYVWNAVIKKPPPRRRW
jgi:hypothetical protein